MLYFPILRAKKGEILALTNLKHSSLNVVKAILQVTQPDLAMDGSPTPPSSEYVSKIANTLQAVVGFESKISCYLDPSPAKLSKDLLADLLFAIARYGGTPHPVYALKGAQQYANLYKQLIGHPKEAIVRVGLADMEDFDSQEVATALKNYELDSFTTFLLLDLGDISTSDYPPGLLAGTLKGIISEVANLNLAGFIVASAALPTKDESPKWKPTQFIRKELAIFKKVKSNMKYPLHFSDYATGNVIKEPTPSRLGSPKIRYTLPEHYEVLRGEKIGRSPTTMSEQYYKISQYIVKLPEYSGSEFSWGDTYIFMASKPATESRGNATTWVAVNTSHHVELVVSMLPSM